MITAVDGLPWWSQLVFLPFFAMIAVTLWAVVDAAATRSARWQQAGLNKWLWLLVIWLVFGLGGIYYAVRIRPRLAHAAAASAP
jgi:hypothetical protein